MPIATPSEIPEPIVYVHQIAGGLYGVHTPASVKEGQKRGFDVSMYSPCVLQSDMERIVHEKNVAIDALSKMHASAVNSVANLVREIAVVNAALIEKNATINELSQELQACKDKADTLVTDADRYYFLRHATDEQLATLHDADGMMPEGEELDRRIDVQLATHGIKREPVQQAAPVLWPDGEDSLVREQFERTVGHFGLSIKRKALNIGSYQSTYVDWGWQFVYGTVNRIGAELRKQTKGA